MKTLTTLLSFFLVTACVYHSGFSNGFAKNQPNLTASQSHTEYSHDTLIIFFEKNSAEPLLQAVKDLNAEILYRYTMMNGVAVRLVKGSNLDQSINYFRNIKGVLSVEKDSISILN